MDWWIDEENKKNCPRIITKNDQRTKKPFELKQTLSKGKKAFERFGGIEPDRGEW